MSGLVVPFGVIGLTLLVLGGLLLCIRRWLAKRDLLLESVMAVEAGAAEAARGTRPGGDIRESAAARAALDGTPVSLRSERVRP